jgi:signal transduction histidine kinase/CheY-like chemotaxis protein
MELALVLFFLALGGCGVGLAYLARRDLVVLRRLNLLLEQRAEQSAADLKAAQAEARLQSARAASAMRARTDFLASMSHELRTPLNAVVGFADLLLVPESKEPLTHRQQQALEEIRKGGVRLSQLVDEVLDLVEIDAGRTIVKDERVDPILLARQACDDLLPLAKKASVELKPPPLAAGLIARGDRMRLKQVLVALIQNGIQYNRSGGTVLIEVHQHGAQVSIHVRDTGLGLPSGRQEEVFEPFNRVGRETSSLPGMGIGLAVARKLVEAMGGQLSVESEQGRGSSFDIVLNAADAEAAEVIASPVPRRSLPQSTLLYIEDNPSNISLMKHVISAIGGLELHIAETGLQGLALARDLQPDVIILDINLPGMHGYEVMARLKAEPLTQSLPVLALSANASRADLKRGREAGFFDYLTKPLNIGLLVDAIARALPEADPIEQALLEGGEPLPQKKGLGSEDAA